MGNAFNHFRNDKEALISNRGKRTLTQEEEKSYIHRIREGDEIARKEFIEFNLGFIHSIANEMALKTGNPTDDKRAEYVNLGTIGLDKAIDKYDPSKGFKFISYAVWWMRQSIENFQNKEKHMWMKSVNDGVEKKLKKEVKAYVQAQGHEPSYFQLKEIMKEKYGTGESTFDKALNQYHNKKIKSLDDKIGTDEDSGTLIDLLSDDNGEYKDVGFGVELVQEQLKKLPEEYKEIIIQKFYGGQSIENIAEEQGKTKIMISNLYEKAIRQLKINLRQQPRTQKTLLELYNQ